MTTRLGSRGLLVLLSLCLAMAAAPAARAAVVLPQTPESLTRESTLVVRGTVLAQEQGFDAAVGRQVVRTRVKVSEKWKGEAPAEVVVQQLGRLVRGQVSGIPGDARMRVGEEVVLFLAEGTGREAGAYFVVGLAQGKYSVTPSSKGMVATPAVGGLSFPHAADRANVAVPRALEALKAAVRKAAAPLNAPTPTLPKGVTP